MLRVRVCGGMRTLVGNSAAHTDISVIRAHLGGGLLLLGVIPGLLTWVIGSSVLLRKDKVKRSQVCKRKQTFYLSFYHN